MTSVTVPGSPDENLLKNPMLMFDRGYRNLILRSRSPLHVSGSDDDDHTSDEDQSCEEEVEPPADHLPIPEVLCNLRDIEVPIDNDIIFEVDANDSIRISSAGSCSELKAGDM
jgi:hypothetical protein